MTNDELAVLVLEWALEHRPDAYEKTIAASVRPSFRKYLLRLIELRIESDRQFARAVPLSVLDETSVVLRVRRGDRDVTLHGSKAQGDLRFSVLALVTSMTDFDLLLSASRTLDIELVSIDNDDDTDNRLDYTRRGTGATGDA